MIEDAYLYKLKSIKYELSGQARDFANGKFSAVISQEKNQKEMRETIANIIALASKIRAEMGNEFRSEFGNAKEN